MNVRWMAVLTGFLVDVTLSVIVQIFARPEFFSSPDIARTDDLVVLVLSLLATGVGGYVAGRMAGSNRVMNGFLVAIVGILYGALGGPQPRPLVIATAFGCVLAAAGGFLSRFPPPRPGIGQG